MGDWSQPHAFGHSRFVKAQKNNRKMFATLWAKNNTAIVKKGAEVQMV